MNPGGEGCNDLRLHHCTPAWATEQDFISNKERKKEREGGKEKEERRGGEGKSILSRILFPVNP